MGQAGTDNRLTSSRATGSPGGRQGAKAPPKVYVNSVPHQKKLLLEFDDWVFRYEVIKRLFKAGSLPPGFTLAPTLTSDGEPSLKWTLSWTERMESWIGSLTQEGNNLVSKAISGGEMTPAELVGKQISQAVIRDAVMAARREQNKRFLPWLQMTAAEALQKLSDGAYIASPAKGIIGLRPAPPGEPYQFDPPWLKEFENGGYFVWVGYQQGFEYRWEKTLDMCEVSTYPNFRSEMTWFLQHGYSLKKALEQYQQETKEIFIAFAASFALALSSAPSTGGRADVGEEALGAALRDSDRMIGSESRLARAAKTETGAAESTIASSTRDVDPLVGDVARPVKDFGNFTRQIDPIEAAQTSVIAAAQLAEDLENKKAKDDADLQGVYKSATEALAINLAGLSEKTFNKELRTGQMGEAIVKKTLELRGYSVVELQNASGHGIDLVGIKLKDKGSGLIVYLEVKSSSTDYPGRLSAAQQNPVEFVKSRLQRVVDRQGFYKNVDPRVAEVAGQLIAEIDSGRPVGGIRATVRWLSKGLSFEVEFKHWESPMRIGQAPVNEQEKRQPGATDPERPVGKRR
jgi:Holliday junction resolvase-like predicted endonuclease